MRRATLARGTLERWRTPDGDFLQLFRLPASEGVPRLILLHGLEGGLRSHYAGAAIRRAAALGWGVDFLLFRSCGTELNIGPRLYHSGETTDLDFVVRRIARSHPQSSLLLLGYSLGGNVLLKWLGELGRGLPRSVRAAAAVSVPFDLEAGARHMRRPCARPYERHFVKLLRRKAFQKLGQFPGLFSSQALAKASSIVEFDEAVTARVHGFTGASDYYSRSSAIHCLRRISIPTLLLSAYDDPFLPASVLADVAERASGNPVLYTAFSEHGGHVGFVAGRIPARPKYYCDQEVFSFLLHVLRSGPD